MRGLANWYLVLFGLASLVSGLLVAITWRLRDRPGGVYAFLFMLTTSIWTVGDLLNILAGPLWLQKLLVMVTFVGVTFVTAPWLLYTLVYTGNEHWITRRTVAAIVGVGTAFLLFVWTDPVHGLAFDGATVHEPSGMYVVDVSTAFLLFNVYSYVNWTISFVLLGREFVITRRFYRVQIGLVLVAMVAPIVPATMLNLELVPFDPTPLGYLVSGTIVTWAVSRAGLMDIVPVARELVVDSVDAGILVVDDTGTVVDWNPQAGTLLGVSPSLVGDSLQENVADMRALVDVLGDTDHANVVIETAGRIVDVDVSPLWDRRGRFSGQVLLLNDVTEKRRRKRELERQNEQLENFATLVSHDLRNPLNVASGRAELLEHDDDPEHLETLKLALGRMDAIIDDALTLARDGRSIEETELVELDGLVREAWANVETDEATLDVETGRTLQAEPDRFLRLLENLFRNAVEHGGQSVTVTVGDLTGGDGFYVTDDGPGIPPEKRDQVFESGYTDSPDGTGFGLAIVESIAEAHGWTVRAAASEAGARFEFATARSGVERTAVTESPD